MTPPLSVFIIAKDEAHRIGRVIEAVQGLAAEVVVVDSGSSDGTPEVAERLGARLFHNDWPGYGPQKRFAEERCANDWLLNLDADEVLTPALREEIQALFEKGEPPLPLYRMKVTAVDPFADRPRPMAEHNNVLRLYDRRVARFPDHPTWDAIEPPAGAEVGQLHAPCHHHSFTGVEQNVAKVNHYTTMQAENQPLKPYWVLALRLLIGPPFDFLKCYLGRRYITGGLYGFVLSVVYTFAKFLKNAKMLERHLKQRQEKS